MGKQFDATKPQSILKLGFKGWAGLAGALTLFAATWGLSSAVGSNILSKGQEVASRAANATGDTLKELF